MAEILWLTKRRYMGKDLVAEKFGRYYELPRHLAAMEHRVTVLALAYRNEPDVRLIENAGDGGCSGGKDDGLRVARGRGLLWDPESPASSATARRTPAAKLVPPWGPRARMLRSARRTRS